MRFKIILTASIIAALAIIAFAVKPFVLNDEALEVVNPQQEQTETVKPEEPKEVTLIAVGDVLAHTPVLAAANMGNGAYDFKSLFTVMKDEIQSADIAVVNQETILGGTEGGYPYDGYPNFNTPDSMGDALIDAGFDVVLQASNHSMDAGTSGINHSIQYWKSHAGEITMLGLNESQDERNRIRVIEKNGITFALLNYTYGLNGHSLSEDESHLVNILNSNTLEQIKSDISTASGLADLVIVFPHWGVEDRVGEPTSEQQFFARQLTEAGADLIIGTHPHVLESVEWVQADNGNQSLCYYSLGNYTSNQQELAEVLGGMAKVKIVKENDITSIKADETGIIPIVTQNDRSSGKSLIQTYHLSDYTEEMARAHDIYLRFDQNFSLSSLQSLANEVLGNWIRSD